MRMTIPVPRPHFHRQSLFRVHAEIWTGGGVRVSWLPPASWRVVEPFNLFLCELGGDFVLVPALRPIVSVHFGSLGNPPLCISGERMASCIFVSYFHQSRSTVGSSRHSLLGSRSCKGPEATAAAVCSLFPSPVRSVAPCRLPPDCFWKP
ncbi:hypothetical protein V8C44DRAFT_343340 [Trichoderma aethiopicum]